MKIKLLSLFFLISLSCLAQYTSIPDINFENKLIALGIDSGSPDHQVLTDKIDKLTDLDISNSAITDLTGIQNFVSLTSLNCYNNQLTVLDVSKNIALQKLVCSSNQLTSLNISMNVALENLECNSNPLTSLDTAANTVLKYLSFSHSNLTSLDISKNIALESLTCISNQLTSLDVSKNIALESLTCTSNQLTSLNVSKNTALGYLSCWSNQLTSLDVSKNTALKHLACSINQLTSLDVSKNTALEFLSCSVNQLTTLDLSMNINIKEIQCEQNQLISLNLKNGNNTILNSMDCTSNPNLSCIQVDDVSYSNTSWSVNKNSTTTYSLSCPSLGIAETVFDKITVYPNPAKGELHIDNSTLEKATVYDTLGKLITTTKFTNGSNNNTINLAGFRSGLYYLYLENEGATIVKKIIIE
ncbi:MAG TPA: T9SS type A sorting domain-containing protein [Flavobacterium sp.]|uniref:T9SS type A sorting domain-containing protein n=1 Tax=Flavobacterium sp. TaxID=239 RepID=UPI0028EC0EA8|nr:T9SS type A sorting domain-containing protein [uncultured Flavobacterium sp.]